MDGIKLAALLAKACFVQFVGVFFAMFIDKGIGIGFIFGGVSVLGADYVTERFAEMQEMRDRKKSE